MKVESRRRWFQIHLSTLIVGVFLSGVTMPIFLPIITMWLEDRKRGGLYLDEQPIYAAALIGWIVWVLYFTTLWERRMRRREADRAKREQV